jgi:hypothetical protein
MNVKNGLMWLTIQWIAVSAIFALTFYALIYDITNDHHDSLEVVWGVLAGVAFISSVFSGMAIWRIRARGK